MGQPSDRKRQRQGHPGGTSSGQGPNDDNNDTIYCGDEAEAFVEPDKKQQRLPNIASTDRRSHNTNNCESDLLSALSVTEATNDSGNANDNANVNVNATAHSNNKCHFRIEAIFLPKFDNENCSDKSIREGILSRISAGQGFAEVTLKHSGSLLLWSGGQRFYSKNSANNAVTQVGEILLRQHFYRTAVLLAKNNQNADINNEDGKSNPSEEALFKRCSDHVEKHRLTLAFEVVSSSLGDHGRHSTRDYLILTVVSDRSRTISTTASSQTTVATAPFYSTLKILQLAQTFYLPHNDAFVFASVDSWSQLLHFYDTSRETGMAATTNKALSQAAEISIPSMYPHLVVHSDLLEGFVIRYVAFRQQTVASAAAAKGSIMDQLRGIAAIAHERLQQLPPESPPAYELALAAKETSVPPVVSLNLRDLLNEIQNHTINTSSEANENRHNKTTRKDVAQEFGRKLQAILLQSGPRTNVAQVTSSVSDALQTLLPEYCEKLDEMANTETMKVARVLQTLSRMGVRVHYSIFHEAAIDDGSPGRWLCMIHIQYDRTFQKYRKAQQKDNDNGGMIDLYRGFCIEICCHNHGESSQSDIMETVPENRPSTQEEPVMTSLRSETETASDGLILKMKFVPYMVRTFGCRNGINFVRQGGLSRYNDYIRDPLNRWQISVVAMQKWMPFLHAWGEYVQACLVKQTRILVLLSSTLGEECYLQHLMHFEAMFDRGKAFASATKQSDGEAENGASCTRKVYKGLTIVLAVDCKAAEKAAAFIATKWLDGTQLLEGGVESISRAAVIMYRAKGRICWGGVGTEKMRKVRMLDASERKDITIVVVGCSQDEINARFPETIKDQRKLNGQATSWRKSKCGAVFDLPGTFTDSSDDNSVSREIWRNSENIEDIDTRPGVLIFFPAMLPGSGKSTLVCSDTHKKLEDALSDIIQSTADSAIKVKKRSVSILVGDKEQRKAKFWSALKEDRLSNNSTITIADKNVPAPTWDLVAQICSSTNARALPVVPEIFGVFENTVVEGARTPDDPNTVQTNKHHYPFSLLYLAVCMARVMEREGGSHPGKLDSAAKYACMIVLKFYSFYRGRLAEDFLENLGVKMSKYGALGVSKPVTLPFFDRNKSQNLPEDLKAVLTEALQAQFGWDTQKLDIKKNVGGGYIDRLELELRNTIRKHRGALLGLTVPEAACQKLFVSQVFERLLEVDGLTSSDQGFIKIVSIDIPRHAVHAILALCATLDSNVLGGKLVEDSCVDGEYQLGEHVRHPHVTLAHYKQLTQNEMRSRFETIQEKEVNVEVTALLWNENIAALSVDVANKTQEGNEIARPQNSYSHVTVWHRDGVSPAESNGLPGLLATGHANRTSFPEKVSLIGKLSYWSMDKH